MAPAAAPPHRGLPAGQAGPGRGPDGQGSGRRASPGAAASRLGRSYGRGGKKAAPAGGRAEARGRLPRPGGPASRGVHRGSAQAPEPGRPRLRQRRRPAGPAAPPGLGRVLLLCLSPRSGGGPLASPPPRLRYDCGGGRRRAAAALLLIASSPPLGGRPARVTSREPWGPPGVCVGGASRTRAHPGPPPPPQKPPQRPGPPTSARSGRLGPPPGPRAGCPAAQRSTEHARRGGAGRPGSPPRLRPAGSLFQTRCPAYCMWTLPPLAQWSANSSEPNINSTTSEISLESPVF